MYKYRSVALVFSYLSDNAPPPSADAVEGYWAEVLYCFTALLLYCYLSDNAPPPSADAVESYWAEVHARSPRALLYCFTALLALLLGASPVSDGNEAPALLLLLYSTAAAALLLYCFTTRCKPGFRRRGFARARLTPSLLTSPRRLPCSRACLW